MKEERFVKAVWEVKMDEKRDRGKLNIFFPSV